jgi:hypothetical protein
MRRTLVSLIVLLLLIPAHAIAVDWTTRGGGPARSQASPQSFGAIDAMAPAWHGPVNTGATGSQPVVIGDKIYHLGGQSLWEVDFATGTKTELAAGLGFLSDGSWRPSTSSLVYTTVSGQPRLYYATGSNALCVMNPGTGESRCHRLVPEGTEFNWPPTPSDEKPVVSTPLVMKGKVDGRELDFVVMGDKGGRLWVFQGFGTFDYPYIWEHWQVGGWLLASMVDMDEAPLTFVWGNTSGWIYAHSIVPGSAGLKPDIRQVWEEGFHTPGQIADGFVKIKTASGERVIALDSIGNLQVIRATDGRATVAHLDGIAFANASPAVDDQNIYLSIRETTAGTGALIAVDRQTLTEKWRQPLKAKANTNPLVLTGDASAVLVGDTLGTLYAFDRQTGTSSNLFLGQEGKPLFELADLPAPMDPLGESYQTLTGLSETILAGDPPMLITGITGSFNKEPDGYLFAYRTLAAFNVGWDETTIDPTKGEAHLTLKNGPPVKGVPYAFYWQPEGAPEPTFLKTDAIDLSLGQQMTVTFPAQTGPGKLTAVVNPVALIAANDPFTPILLKTKWPVVPNLAEAPKDAADNIRTGESLLDLAVTLTAPSTLPCSPGAQATVTFTATQETVATVKVTFGSTTLLSGALKVKGSATRTLNLLVTGCDKTLTLTAQISSPTPEPNLANNQATAQITIGPPGAPGGVQGGDQKAFYVPADCQVNPDWTSHQPCLNYPDLIVP